MTYDWLELIGYFIGSYAVGWIIGYWQKIIRQGIEKIG